MEKTTEDNTIPQEQEEYPSEREILKKIKKTKERQIFRRGRNRIKIPQVWGQAITQTRLKVQKDYG